MNNTESNKDRTSVEAYDGWRLGVQTWSFKKFTLFEALDKTRSLGLNWVQAYPGQKVSADIKTKFGPDLTAQQRQMVKGKLKDTGIGIFAFGVTKIP
ncbi:MAG: hypothetical protein KAR47_05735, partial [Planctomycetes bacterium]|nr:hypothetical protein [Planctomycetota bacterium]